MYQNNGFNNPGIPMEIYQNPGISQQQQMPMQMNYYQQQQPIPPMFSPEIANFVPPVVTMDPPDGSEKKSLFTIVDSGPSNPIEIPGTSEPEPTNKRKRSRSKKESTKDIVVSGSKGPSEVEKTNGIVEDSPTAYTYMETTGLLRETLGQIDALNGELVQEFQNVRQNRTMKNKYNVMVGISENIGALIGNRIQAIREINNSITKANDLDYKKLKDMKAAQSVMNDDKYIADVYQAMISNPANLPATNNLPPVDPSIFGSGIVRANITDPAALAGNIPMDIGYLNYMSNLTPEQNLMRYENNPNVKQVVVYDAATNNKFFQMMDISTGEVIPNVPVYDQNIMEDTTLDVDHMIAKNINLNETFPIVMINNDITSQY